jgi:hypothetical protein
LLAAGQKLGLKYGQEASADGVVVAVMPTGTGGLRKTKTHHEVTKLTKAAVIDRTWSTRRRIAARPTLFGSLCVL